MDVDGEAFDVIGGFGGWKSGVVIGLLNEKGLNQHSVPQCFSSASGSGSGSPLPPLPPLQLGRKHDSDQRNNMY